MNIYSTVLLTTSSSVLITYSSVADSQGWAQGNFFRSQKAMLLGWIGLAAGLVASYYADGLTSVGIALVAAFFLTGILLGALKQGAQALSIFAFAVGVIWSFFG